MQLRQTLRQLFKRPLATHKYDYGHVLVIGGSPGMVGAPLLAAEAALRTGAGLVTIASVDTVIEKVEKRIKEIMSLRLGSKLSVAPIRKYIVSRKVNAIVLGPGLSRTSAANKFVQQVLTDFELPIVIDADALYALSQNLIILKQAARKNKNLILTPHEGEYNRLTKHSPAEFAKEYNLHLVLKRNKTQVFHPDSSRYLNNTGNPGLATAGTGDVLSGIIAGLLAQDIPSVAASEGGVYLHGLAGDLAAKAKTQPGLIASDVITYIPSALRETA